MTRRIKKITFSSKKRSEKQRICIRLPIDIRAELKERSNNDYKGRGKQSLLVEDAILYYLFCSKSINWEDYQRDSDYAELIDDINEGLNQKNLGEPTQIFLSKETVDKLTELETKILLSKPTMRDARTGLIRKAISIRLNISKEFFDGIMKEGCF